MASPRKLIFFQYGAFAEAFRTLQGGGAETYRDQRRSIDYVVDRPEECVVVSMSVTHEEVQLTPRLRSIGIMAGDLREGHIKALFEDYQPDLAVVRTPHRAILQAAVRRGIPVMPCFADLFERGDPRTRLNNLRLARTLNAPQICCAANHNMNASRSLATAVGMSSDRIVPWDWSRIEPDPNPKTAPNALPRAFFAGALSIEKGVADCLQAVALLKKRGTALHFSFAGGGDVEMFRKMSVTLDVQDEVTWLGTVPNTEVRTLMRAHDLVIVPSHHSYAEGLPNTIYEGLASRSPLLISNHPAFLGRVPGDACLTFKASDANDMATKMQTVLENSTLYASLSAASASALSKLYFGIEWEDLMTKWLDDPLNRSGWVQQNSLKALQSEMLSPA